MTPDTQENPIREWSRSLMADVMSQPRTIGVDLGSWERTVEWTFNPATGESEVTKDHGWKRVG
jgi:hypothetical protein